MRKKRRFFYLFVFPGFLGIMVFVLLPFIPLFPVDISFPLIFISLTLLLAIFFIAKKPLLCKFHLFFGIN